MHAEQDRVARSGAAPCATASGLDEFGARATRVVSVMIASDRRPVYSAWLSRLAGEADIEIRGEPIVDAAGLSAWVSHHLPNVLLLDKTMFDLLDPRSLRRIQELHPRVRMLMIGDGIRHDLVADFLRNRLHGFVPTICPPDICLKAIRAVSRGELWLSRAALSMALVDMAGWPRDEVPVASTDAFRVGVLDALTPRERQVVALLRRGCINKEIAQELGIMEDTVKKHLQSVFAKLGVHRRSMVALCRVPGAMSAT